jgi:hypothetical protein
MLQLNEDRRVVLLEAEQPRANEHGREVQHTGDA